METTIDSEMIKKGKLFDWDYFTKEITNVFKLSEKEIDCPDLDKYFTENEKAWMI